MKTLNEEQIKELLKKEGLNNEVIGSINFAELEETVLSCTTTEEALKKLAEKYPEIDQQSFDECYKYVKEELDKQLYANNSDSEEVVDLEDDDLESVAGGSVGSFFKKHWPAIVTFVGVSALAYFGMKKFGGTKAAAGGTEAAAEGGEAAEAGKAAEAAKTPSMGKNIAGGLGYMALGVVPQMLTASGD